MWKRVLSVLLVYCFVISMAVPGFASETVPGFASETVPGFASGAASDVTQNEKAMTGKNNRVYPQQVNNGKVDSQGNLLDGGIGIALEQTFLGENRYDITLALSSKGGGESMPPTATVLLLDTSHAAAQSGQLSENITAITEYIQQALTQGSEHQIALAVCHEQAQILVPLTGEEGKETLLAALNTLPQGAGLYLEQGLRVAGEELNRSQNSAKQIVLFTNGETTYSTKVAENSVTLTARCSLNCNGQATAEHWDYDLAYVPALTRIGQDTGFATDVFFHRVDYAKVTCQYGNPWHDWGIRKFPRNHGDTALFEASQLRRQGISIAAFATGASTASEGGRLLQGLASNGVAWAGSYDDLLGALTPPPSQPAFTQGELSLALGELAVVETDSIACSLDTIARFQESSATFRWELGVEEQASLSFTVELAVEQPDFVMTVKTPLFAEGAFSYLDEDNIPQMLEAPNVGLLGEYSTLFKQGVWVNAEMGYLTESGVIASEASQAKMVSPPVPLLNTHGVNQWRLTPAFSVGDDSIVPTGSYVSHPNSTQQTVAVTELDTEKIIYFPFVATDLQYQVGHYYDGENLPFHVETIDTVPYGTTVSTLSDSPQLAAGFQRTETHINPAVIVDNFAVFRAVYAPDLQQILPYDIMYYQGDILVGSEQKSVLVASPQVTVTPSDNRYEGYKLGSILFGGVEEPASITGIITQAVREFHVYYEADLTQTLPYAIESYEDNVLINTDTHSVWIGNPTVTITPAAELHPDCLLVGVEFGGAKDSTTLTGTVTATEAIFQVFYETKPPDPEPERWPYYIHSLWDGVAGDVEERWASDDDSAITLRPVRERDGYRLEKIVYDGREESTSLSAALTKEKNHIYVHYTVDITKQIAYYVEHYYDGVLDSVLTQQINTPLAHSTVTQVLQQEKAGYLFDATQPELPTKVSNGDKIQVHYKKVPTGSYEYSVQYYKDGVLAGGETTFGQVPATNPSIKIRPNPKMFSGYELDRIEFAGQQESEEITGLVNDTDNLFAVFYVSKVVPAYHYTVEYYYDSVLDPTKSESRSVLAGDSQVYTVPDKSGTGFVGAEPFTTPALPHAITRTGEIISVFYVSEKKPPEPPQPPAEDNRPLMMHLGFYILGDLQGEVEETILVATEQRVVVGGLLGKKTYQGKDYAVEQIFITERIVSQPQGDSPASSSPTLGASGVTLGQSGNQQPDETQAAPLARNTVSFQQMETNEYRLNQHDVFFFHKENEYDIEVIYRLTTVIPPPLVEKVPENNTKETAVKKEKAELPDKSSPPPVVTEKSTQLEKTQGIPTQQNTAVKAAGIQTMKLPQTGGQGTTVSLPLSIACVLGIRVLSGRIRWRRRE